MSKVRERKAKMIEASIREDTDDLDMHIYIGDSVRCPDCGGQMIWCSNCQIYTQICCVEYGTCMCS
jgi:cytochrome c-type biogenesis protein CcmH/NrfF